MKNIEMEYKWEANTPQAFVIARRTLKKMVGPILVKRLNIQDTYLDTCSAGLSSKNIALRIRNTGNVWEATFKTRTQIKQGKAIRQEETLSLPKVKNFSDALRILTNKKRWKGISLTNLEPQFFIYNKRSIYLFSYADALLEMSLDDVTIDVLGRQLKMKEIELELKKGSSQTLDKVAKIFSCQTQFPNAQLSKVRTAQTLLKLWRK